MYNVNNIDNCIIKKRVNVVSVKSVLPTFAQWMGLLYIVSLRPVDSYTTSHIYKFGITLTPF